MGSTLAFVVPRVRHRRVLWREVREPGASSEERGPTPAPHRAQQPPRTGEDKQTCIQFINEGPHSLQLTFFSSLLFLHCRSPVLRRQAMLASSCSQLEAIEVSTSQQRSSIPEFRICPSTPSRQGATPASSAPPTLSTPAAREQSGGQGNGPPFLGQLPLYLRRRAGKVEKDGEGVRRDSEGLLRLVRSHSEPGLGSSTDTGESDTRMRTSLTFLFLFDNLPSYLLLFS